MILFLQPFDCFYPIAEHVHFEWNPFQLGMSLVHPQHAKHGILECPRSLIQTL